MQLVQYLSSLCKNPWVMMMMSQQSWSGHEHIIAQSQPFLSRCACCRSSFYISLIIQGKSIPMKKCWTGVIGGCKINGNVFSWIDADDRLSKTTWPPHVFVLWQPAMSIHRIMHWARRIEQEIDRVFQHITGAQQLKGVSVWLSFYSIQVLLIAVLHKLNKTWTRQRVQYAKQLKIH